MLEVTESRNKKTLVWNAIYGNFNSRNIETFNVFDHYSFAIACQKNAKKNKDNKEAFADQLKRDLMYFFWSKCEWEVIVSHWPSRDDFNDAKIDIYDQVRMNWMQFVDYVWENKEKLKCLT